MTFARPWVGTRRVAFVPVFRPNAAPPDQLPADWPGDILRRVLDDPRTEAGGRDRSVRGWLQAASSGRADIEPVVVPMQTINRQVVEARDLEGALGGQLRDQGCDHAVLVMLGGRGAGTNDGFWSRVAMAESNGVWLMEMIHGLTDLKDYYHFGNDIDPAVRDIDSFDEMSASSQTHPTAFTKRELGWLEDADIRRLDGPSAEFALHHMGLPKPPPAGRVAAVQLGETPPYVMIEARSMTDQFEAGMPSFPPDFREYGIGSQGVIAYRVQTPNPTVQERPERRKPLYLLTPRALLPGQSAGLDNGVTLTVTAALADGFGVVVDDPLRHVIDRTARTSARSAAGSPAVVALPSQQLSDVVYRDTGEHLDEIWRGPSGSGTTDLTASAGAPSSSSDPWFYYDPAGDQVVIVFRGKDNRVRTLYWMYGAVGHDDLTGAIGAPAATGVPAGWFSTHDGFHHVVYRGANGHLTELWWQGQGGVGHGDLTAQAGAVPAAGNPWPYYDPTRSTNIVPYRGADGRIRALYWAPDGAVGQDDLSGTAQAPNATSDPFAWYTPAEDVHRVVYVAGNGHVHELAWTGVAPVGGRDLTTLTGVAAAQGRVSGGYNAAHNTQHVIVRSGDGHLHELWHFLGDPTVHAGDLTAAFGAPPASLSPCYFSTPWPPHQHVAYRSTDGHVCELLW